MGLEMLRTGYVHDATQVSDWQGDVAVWHKPSNKFIWHVPGGPKRVRIDVFTPLEEYYVVPIHKQAGDTFTVVGAPLLDWEIDWS